MVPDLVARMKVLKESHADAVTAGVQAVVAQDECITGIRDLQTDVKILTETQARMAPEMNLQFTRTTERLSRLKEAKWSIRSRNPFLRTDLQVDLQSRKPRRRRAKKIRKRKKDDEFLKQILRTFPAMRTQSPKVK